MLGCVLCISEVSDGAFNEFPGWGMIKDPGKTKIRPSDDRDSPLVIFQRSLHHHNTKTFEPFPRSPFCCPIDSYFNLRIHNPLYI